MTQRTALHGPTNALHALGRAFQFGPSVDQPGVITATHTATWHMAGLIEQLRSLREDQVKQLRDGNQ